MTTSIQAERKGPLTANVRSTFRITLAAHTDPWSEKKGAAPIAYAKSKVTWYVPSSVLISI
jgi:hypothetical protein